MLEARRPTFKSPSLGTQKAVLGAAFLIILLVSALAFYSTQRLIAASAQVERTQNLLVQIHRFLSEVRAIESSSRGYFITGDERYLQIRVANLLNAKMTAARLRTVESSGDLRQRLERLVTLAGERIEHSNQLIGQQSRAQALRSLHLGANVMDRVRSDAEPIIATQSKAYRLEQRQLEREAWLTSIALAVGVVICLSAIGWLFAERGREVERRRQLEEELRALNLELEDRVQEQTADVKKAIDLLNAVVENIPDMILLKEPSGKDLRYVLINAAGEKLLGLDRSQILGRTEREIFPTEEAALVVSSNQSVIASGQPQIFTDRKLTTASGVRTVETRMVPIANGNGQTLILGIVRDVSETRAREEQLRQLQRIDAIGRLTGGIAHDFNNLLAIIQGNSELLRIGIEAGSEEQDMIDDVIGAAARGAELVKRLLAFARMQHLEPKSIDLNARLHDVLGLLQRTLGGNMHLKVKTAKRPWPAIVDPTQVDDALVNLAINARDAMPEGGTLTIETQNVSLDEEYAAQHVEVSPGDYVMLAVSDTGTGMAPEVVARVFEPFFTTKQEDQGTGLGLSQVFGWVKQSGGHIKIYSELGHGTTVKLYLPRAAERTTEQKPELEMATPTGDETILVVEDNPNVRKTVVRQLKDLGYKGIEADSGAQALQLVKDGLAFDLLLTDVVMPGGMTGYQLADELRIGRPHLKVLFTSGYTELAAAAGDAMRKDPLLSKPYRKQDLGRTLRATLDEPPEGDC